MVWTSTHTHIHHNRVKKRCFNPSLVSIWFRAIGHVVETRGLRPGFREPILARLQPQVGRQLNGVDVPSAEREPGIARVRVSGYGRVDARWDGAGLTLCRLGAQQGLSLVAPGQVGMTSRGPAMESFATDTETELKLLCEFVEIQSPFWTYTARWTPSSTTTRSGTGRRESSSTSAP